VESPNGRDEVPSHVPEMLQREHLVEARRTVANSRGVRAAARRLTTARGDDEASAAIGRWLPSIYGTHGLAALLTVAFAVATTTFVVGAVVLAGIGVSAFVVRSLAVTLVRQHLASGSVTTPDR
jgi:hypothetical protein